MPDIFKRILSSILLAIPGAVVAVVLRGALKAWGILDPFSVWLGGWLKVNISPSQAEWTTAAVIALAGYGAALWFVWRHYRQPTWSPAARGARSIHDEVAVSSHEEASEFSKLIREKEFDWLRQGTKPAGKPVVPDMTIHDLFFHIRPNLLENANTEKQWEIVGREVMDKLATAQLSIWGRELHLSGKLADALTPIPQDYWRNRVFTYHFLYDDKGQQQSDGTWLPHTYSWQNKDGVRYADLHVSREQALRFWPQRFKSIGIEIKIPESPRAVAQRPESSAEPQFDTSQHLGTAREYIPLGDAAFVAYKRLRNTDVGREIDAYRKTPSSKMIETMELMVKHGFVYGERWDHEWLQIIDEDDRHNYRVLNDQGDVAFGYTDEVLYSHTAIKPDDLERFIALFGPI